MCVCVPACVRIFSGLSRHSCCESAPLFPSWVTHPAVAWLLQSESFLLRHCLHGRTGHHIYSRPVVNARIMHVFLFFSFQSMRSACVCVCALLRSVDRSWQITLSSSCCFGSLKVCVCGNRSHEVSSLIANNKKKEDRLVERVALCRKSLCQKVIHNRLKSNSQRLAK